MPTVASDSCSLHLIWSSVVVVRWPQALMYCADAFLLTVVIQSVYVMHIETIYNKQYRFLVNS